jgi:hypothetical protein
MLVFHLERIQQLVLISLNVLAAKNPPEDTKFYPVHGMESASTGTARTMEPGIYITDCNRYGVFNALFASYNCNMFYERLQLLCQKYKKQVIEDFSEASTPSRSPRLRLSSRPTTGRRLTQKADR